MELVILDKKYSALVTVPAGKTLIIHTYSLDGTPHCARIEHVFHSKEVTPGAFSSCGGGGALWTPTATQEVTAPVSSPTHTWGVSTEVGIQSISTPGTYRFVINNPAELGMMSMSMELVDGTMLLPTDTALVGCPCADEKSYIPTGILVSACAEFCGSETYVFSEFDTKDPAATVELSTCAGEKFYIYPTAGTGHTEPVKDGCSGATIGFAVNKWAVDAAIAAQIRATKC